MSIRSVKEKTTMIQRIGRRIGIGVMVMAFITPAAFAAGSPTGTDPEPKIVHSILAFFGLA
jgi:hypothetical protein